MGNTTIIIPTYFGGKLVAGCVNSILTAVKNPIMLVYKNDIGWLKAANHLMSMIDTDIILLNDDTLVLTDIVEHMETLAYSDPKIGIVGGMALAASGDTIINYGIYVAPDGNTAHKHFGQRADEVDSVETQKAVEGSCMFIKREVLNDIGYFDEGYGSGYREEVDLCFRAREKGYKVVSSPLAKYVHFVNQTHGKVGITNDTHEYFMSKWGTKLRLGKV